MKPWHVVDRNDRIMTVEGFDTREDAKKYAKDLGGGTRVVKLADVTREEKPAPKTAWIVTSESGSRIGVFDSERIARECAKAGQRRLFRVLQLEEVEP